MSEDLAGGEGVAFGYFAEALLQVAGELGFIQRLLWHKSNGTSDDDGFNVPVERKAASLRFCGKLRG